MAVGELAVLLVLAGVRRAQPFFVSRRVGEHALGVGAAVCGDEYFHGASFDLRAP